MRFDELDDFHDGFESYGCRCLLVTQNVSKSVECEVDEAAEFVQRQVGPMVAGGEQGAGEAGVFLGPEMDGGAVDAGLFSGGGDRLACARA